MKQTVAAVLAMILVLSLCLSFAPQARAETVPSESAADAATTEPAQTEEDDGIKLSLEFWIVWALAINALTLLCMHRITRHTREKYSM